MDPMPSFLVEVAHIADVQELSKSEPTVITGRFVLDMAERPKLTAIVSSPNDIPIIDLSKLMSRTVQGYGQAFVFSENQKLDWCNMFALGVEPPCIRNPNLWPLKPARLRYLTTIP
ncbi:hypothetical protein CXB51_023906 [Gossypium anomalum]|uniref:Uncharacterized protein n=1 Tax=Gossypium anomalum TaxID=47600 RepID=A0A8J5YIZ5_9ROSI|nr:hypothetical protein CXB51_023906 [Gossypium anomalum]